MKKIIISIFCVMALLSGCTGNKGKENTVDIAGKTFYDTADSFVYTERSRVWLGKDESFVLSDYYVGGMDEYTGTWSIKDGVVTLKDQNREFKFEVQDENNIVLRTSLHGANASDVFSTEKPDTEILPYGIENFDYVVYYNACQDENNRSFLELHSDKSFSLIEKGPNGTIDINGMWGTEGSVYMFSNFDPFKDCYGNTVYNFEFMTYDENSLILNEDLDGSKKGDIFTTDGKIPAGYTHPSETFAFQTQTYIHEPFYDIDEKYLPTFTIASDFSFSFMENTNVGMAKITGYCSPEQYGWACQVLDSSALQGFAGYGVKEIRFESVEEGVLELKTNICISLDGHRFILAKD